jgi:hypothetical protein
VLEVHWTIAAGEYMCTTLYHGLCYVLVSHCA